MTLAAIVFEKRGAASEEFGCRLELRTCFTAGQLIGISPAVSVVPVVVVIAMTVTAIPC